MVPDLQLPRHLAHPLWNDPVLKISRVNHVLTQLRFFLRQNPIFPTSKDVLFLGFCHCAADLQTQVPNMCTALDLGLLYILILGTYSKFAWKNSFVSLGVCFPQPRSSAGRRFAESRSRLQNYRPTNRFVSKQKIR